VNASLADPVGAPLADSAPLRPVIRRLGLVEYEPTWREMQRFTNERDASTRTVFFDLGFDIGGAGGQAHAAMDALLLCRQLQVTNNVENYFKYKVIQKCRTFRNRRACNNM